MWILQPLLVGLVVLGFQSQPINGGVPMPGPGGDTSGTGGPMPDVGVNMPGVGGPMPGLGGVMSGTGGPMPDIGGIMPDVGGPIPGLGGDMSGTGGPMPDVGGIMPDVGGPMPGLGGDLSGTGGTMPDVGGIMPDVGGPIPGLGGEMSGTGGPMPDVGGDMPAVGGPMPGLGGDMSGTGGNTRVLGGDMSGTGGPMPDVGGNLPDVGGPVPGLGDPIVDVFTKTGSSSVGGTMPGVGGNRPVLGGELGGFGSAISELGGQGNPYAAECLRQQCQGMCFLTHPTSCHKYIVCQPSGNGGFYAQVMPCAFGTMWKSVGGPACDTPKLVACPKDPCRNPNLASYKHDDKNCRTFWTCDKGHSVASCCNLYQRFFNGTCVEDVTCADPCPLLNDATCAGPNVTSLNFPDGNCKTHFVCVNGRPHPVCCKEGERYDILSGICVPDPTCKQPCPQDYQALCSKLDVTSYPLLDNNCRTYMKCNAEGLDEPHCCLEGYMYDPQSKQCVNGSLPYDCEFASCPRGYIHVEECPYEAIPNNLYVYKNLDSHGGHLMNCPVGTFFNQSECRCAIDHDFYARVYAKGPASCDIAVHVKFPNLKNLGVAGAAILMIGDYGQGERGVGNMQTQWAGVNIPFYGGQELSSFYLEMTFTPTGYSRLPQVLLSSCSYRTYPGNWERPSLEVSILPPGNTTNIMSVGVGNKQGTTYVTDGLVFQLNATYTLRVIYDGSVVGIFMDPIGVLAGERRHELRGLVPIHVSGLRFSHCRYEKDVARFIGTVDEIMFSKCVDDKMKSTLYPAAATPGVP